MSKSHFDRIGVKNKMARACELAQVRLSSAVLSDSNRFIPMDTGVLKASGRIENQNKQVSWNTQESKTHIVTKRQGCRTSMTFTPHSLRKQGIARLRAA